MSTGDPVAGHGSTAMGDFRVEPSNRGAGCPTPGRVKLPKHADENRRHRRENNDLPDKRRHHRRRDDGEAGDEPPAGNRKGTESIGPGDTIWRTQKSPHARPTEQRARAERPEFNPQGEDRNDVRHESATGENTTSNYRKGAEAHAKTTDEGRATVGNDVENIFDDLEFLSGSEGDCDDQAPPVVKAEVTSSPNRPQEDTQSPKRKSYATGDCVTPAKVARPASELTNECSDVKTADKTSDDIRLGEIKRELPSNADALAQSAEVGRKSLSVSETDEGSESSLESLVLASRCQKDNTRRVQAAKVDDFFSTDTDSDSSLVPPPANGKSKRNAVDVHQHTAEWVDKAAQQEEAILRQNELVRRTLRKDVLTKIRQKIKASGSILRDRPLMPQHFRDMVVQKFGEMYARALDEEDLLALVDFHNAHGAAAAAAAANAAVPAAKPSPARASPERLKGSPQSSLTPGQKCLRSACMKALRENIGDYVPGKSSTVTIECLRKYVKANFGLVTAAALSGRDFAELQGVYASAVVERGVRHGPGPIQTAAGRFSHAGETLSLDVLAFPDLNELTPRVPRLRLPSSEHSEVSLALTVQLLHYGTALADRSFFLLPQSDAGQEEPSYARRSVGQTPQTPGQRVGDRETTSSDEVRCSCHGPGLSSPLGECKYIAVVYSLRRIRGPHCGKPPRAFPRATTPGPYGNAGCVEVGTPALWNT